MSSIETLDQEKVEIIRFFNEFFERHSNVFHPKVNAMIEKLGNRIIVDVSDLRSYNAERTRSLLDQPVLYMPCFDKAFEDFVGTIDPNYLKTTVMSLRVGLEGNFGAYNVDPRTLSARYLAKLVSIEGIVTKCSLVRPKVQRSVHYCDGTGKWMFRDYHDATSLTSNVPTSGIYPTDDGEGHPLTTEFGLCVFKDYQRLTIQEMPERAPPGQLPRSVDVMVEEDLVDRAKPGDRIQCVGIFRTLPSKTYNITNGMFRTALLANHLRLTTREVYVPTVGERDIQNIRKIAKRPALFELLAGSLAPSIYGHDFVKKALLLQLLGGLEKNLVNGTHLRGDVNVLLIGDPSTAKSQLLRFILNMAPLAVATTGRGSSGVGLTAAVTVDKETGERRLEAGAMVLADRGIVCIDEFDKMSDADRVAIHEVMEQQTVTIAKAGIHASLNARCSVLAAANPIYGQYNAQKTPTENIALPDSLLSRFDLLFVILDQMDPVRDRDLSAHVLRMHSYRRSGEDDGAPATDLYDRRQTGLGALLDQANARAQSADQDEDDDEEARAARETPVFDSGERFALLGNAQRAQREILTLAFLKKYVHYAKSRIRPTLTKEASVLISQKYSELRRHEVGASRQHKTLPVTARTLETLIRLSTAHAKALLKGAVDVEDVEEAYAIMRFALYKEVERRVRKRKTDEEGGEEERVEEEEETQDDSLARKQSRTEETSSLSLSSQQDVSLSLSLTASPTRGGASQRLQHLRSAVLAVTRNAHKTECTLEEVLTELRRDENEAPIEDKEVVGLLAQLDAQGTLMFREGRIYLMD